MELIPVLAPQVIQEQTVKLHHVAAPHVKTEARVLIKQMVVMYVPVQLDTLVQTVK